jgi:glycosyltransferase involved in cell wall biosynthesis
MKIAIVRREPKAALSMDIYADNLVAELKELKPDWEILEIAPQSWSENLQENWQANPLRKYYERFYRHPQAVKQVDADLFHIIDHSDAHIAYGLKKIGKPVVVTCHDLVQFIYPEIMQNEARFPAFSLAVWQYCVRGITVADSTIAVSSNTGKDIAHWLNVAPGKIAIVPNGVGTTVFNTLDKKAVADWKQKHTGSPDEICLLHVGSNQQRKNVETVLKVIKAIAEQGIPVRLWKVGGDFYPEQRQYIEAHNLSKYITAVSNPEQKTVINFYNAADVLVAPSLYEGFGLTVLEAMACGTPIITSNVSAIPEVAGDAAVLVDPTDVVAIADAVLRIHRDRDFRQELIDRGFARIKEFSWKKTAEKTAQLYEQVVQSKSAIVAD